MYLTITLIDQPVRSINLIDDINESSDLNLQDLFADLYFEIFVIDAEFSNTETLNSSRLFNRYLSTWLKNLYHILKEMQHSKKLPANHF